MHRGARSRRDDRARGGRALPAVSLAWSLPTFSGQVGYARTVDAQLTGYVTKDFGFVHADLNAGLNVWRLDARDGPALAQGMAALALTASLPAPFGVMAEMYAFSDAQPVTAEDSGVLFACTHAARPWLVFDLGGDVGLFPGSRSYSAFLGMSIIPAVLWRP